MNEKLKAKLSLFLSFSIFGTIGIFRRYIPISSTLIALLRGIIGTSFLCLFVFLTKKKISKEAVKKNILLLVISGAMIGINWILLFESYKYTSIASATLCYYMAPIIVIVLSPFVLKEKISLHKKICTLIAFIGMILVSNILESGFSGNDNMIGILYALGAAILYGCVVLMNKKIVQIGPYEKTILQLGSSAIVLLPYALLSEPMQSMSLTPFIIMMILIVGILHTGIAYTLYFSTTDTLDAHTLAIYSYIDPIIAIFLSIALLKEPMHLLEVIGAILILGSTLLSEFNDSK